MRRDDGHRRGAFPAKVEPGRTSRLRARRIGLNVVQGARVAGADKIVGVDVSPAREAIARKFGMTHFVNPKDVKGISSRTSSS